VMSFALTAAATGADNPGPGRSILLPFRFWMGAAIAIDGWLGLYASYAGLAHIAWLALGAFVVLLGIAVLNGGRRGAFGRWLAGMGLVAGWCMVFARIGYSSLDVQQRPLFLAGVWVLMVQPWLPNVAIGLKRWVGLLQDDSLIRQRSLALGAWCFVLGFLLQLAATFGG
jgi:hypothetical protein